MPSFDRKVITEELQRLIDEHNDQLPDPDA